MKRVSVLAIILLAAIFSVGSGVAFTAHVYAQSTSTNEPAVNTAGTTATGSTTSSGTQSTTASGIATSSTISGSGSASATDSTAPVIHDIHTTVAPFGAKIQWVTDDPSESRLIYGSTSGNYPYTASSRCEDGVFVFSHCVYLTNLLPSTQYYFVIMSKNSAGLSTYSTGHSLTTAPNPNTTSGSAATTLSGTSLSATATAPTTVVQTAPISTPTTVVISDPVTTAVPAYTSGVRVLEGESTVVPRPMTPSVKVISPASSTAIVPRTSLETPRTQLENVGTSVRTFQNAVDSLNTSVQSAVMRDVERAIRDAMQSQSVAISGEHAFDPQERQARLEELKRAIQEKQSQLTVDVQTTLTSNVPDGGSLPNIEPALKSSLDDIALLIMNETGVPVDLSPTARTVASDAQEQSAQFDSARGALLERDGLDLYTDTDRDGISDYDEAHIYHTDPRNAYSSGGALTDGEKIVLGFDVSTSTIRRVPVESPLVSGEETRNVFEVHTIAVSHVSVPPAAESATTSPLIPVQVDPSAVPAPVVEKKMTFAGRALPNSFITLYIYSTPIVVTVKTDITGAWKYTLDTELPDGDHNLYVATVDSGGKILAKSPAIPFVKTAEAADFTPLVVTESPAADPLDIVQNNLMIIALAGFAVFAILALGILGLRRPDPKGSDIVSP